MYTKEFYHTREEAYNAAEEAAGKNGIIDTNTCSAEGFDYIARDAIDDERDGECLAFWAYEEDGTVAGVFAYNN